MGRVLQVVLITIFSIIVISALIVGYVFLIIEYYPDADPSFSGVLAVPMMFLVGGIVHFFAYGLPRLHEKRHQRKNAKLQEQHIEDGTVYLRVDARYTEENLLEAFTFLKSPTKKVRQNRIMTLVVSVLLLAAVVYFRLWFYLWVPLMLAAIPAFTLFTARRAAKKAWNTGHIQYGFCGTFLYVRFQNEYSSSENTVQYRFITNVYDTPTAFYLRTKSRSMYYLPKNYMEPGARDYLSRFLFDHFPVKYQRVR